MKKIIGALLVGAMIGGVAFADVAITLNQRTKLEAFSTVIVDDGTDKFTENSWMKWAGYDQGNPSDTLKFAANNEHCGVTFAVNIQNNMKDTGTKALFTLNQYLAWASWGVGPGTLKLEAGNWKDGYADGSYRVKKDVDAQNAEGVDFERFKLGSMFTGNKSKFVDNLNAGNEVLAGYASYNINISDNLNLDALFGGVQTAKYYEDSDDDTKTTFRSEIVSRVLVKAKGLVNAELIYKKPTTRNDIFAVFIKPVMMKDLDATVGFTMDNYTAADSKNDYRDIAIDLRVRYQINKAFSVTTMNNVSITNLDAGRVVASGIAGLKGLSGIAGSKDDYGATKTAVNFKTVMWNNVSARYKINDLITATLNVGLMTPLVKIDGDDTEYGPEWRVTPAVQIYAESKASVWAGVAISGCSMTPDGGDKETYLSVQVPVIMRVKL